MDKIEALQAMLKGEYYIRAARYGGTTYWYDDTVDKFCAQDDDGSGRFTDINCLNNSIELVGFNEYEDARKYAESNENKGIK